MDVPGRRLIKRIVFLVGIMCLVGVAGCYDFNQATIQNELVALDLLPRAEAFTELYFDDGAHLPTSLAAGQTIDFTFVIHNLEAKDYRYAYQVSIIARGSPRLIDRGQVLVKNAAYFRKREHLSLTPSPGRQEIIVELINIPQFIHFWIGGGNAMKKVTVVIPALNEEQGIGLVLKEIPTGELSNMGYETEIMVIDNGSQDRTRHIARQHGAIVIIQPIRGYGNAYKAGFANASGDIIATGDADRTYPFEDLPAILQKMEAEDLDFINTDRMQHVNPGVMTPSHIFGNRVLTILTKMLFSNLPFADSQSGMWVFRRQIWDSLEVKSSGMPFSQELKIEAHIRGFKCSEVPIRYRIRAGDAKLRTIRDGAMVVAHIFGKKLATLFVRWKEGNQLESRRSC